MCDDGSMDDKSRPQIRPSLKHHPPTYLGTYYYVDMHMYVGGLKCPLCCLCRYCLYIQKDEKKGTSKHAGLFLYRIPNRYVSFWAKQIMVNSHC